MSDATAAVQRYYDQVGSAFDASYNWDGPLYPSNRIRLDLALDILERHVPKGALVLDAGCGTGIAMAELLALGWNASGFDFSAVAIERARERLRGDGWRVYVGDMEDGTSYPMAQQTAALVIGAFTHPVNTEKALAHLQACIRPGGLLIVELRNELFDLFTANEYTIASLRRWLPDSAIKDEALAQLSERYYRRPPIPPKSEAQIAHEQFFSVPSVWRNPLTVGEEYRAAGFEPIDTAYFHFHALPPVFEALDPVAFRAASLELEKDPHDWRGLFLASAFLLVAQRR